MDKETKKIVGKIEDKAIKEGKQGEYAEFKIRVDETANYPQTFRWFYDQEAVDLTKIRKGMFVEVEFTETKGSYQGKEVTYKNVVAMKEVKAPVIQQSFKSNNNGTSYDDYNKAKDIRISRNAALNTALELMKIQLSTRKEVVEIKADDLLKTAEFIADKILVYFYNDKKVVDTPSKEEAEEESVYI